MRRTATFNLCPSSVKVLKPQQDDLGGVLEERCAVLLLALLHPVAVDAEGTAIDELAHAPQRVWVPGQEVARYRPAAEVAEVDADAGQSSQDQNLMVRTRCLMRCSPTLHTRHDLCYPCTIG